MTINVKKLLVWAFIFAILMALPLTIEKTNILNFLFLIFLFITLSQSWNILGGYAGQVNLGHAAFFGLGALITRHLWFLGLPFILALLIGSTAALIFALIIGFPAFRLKGAYFVIGMLAMAEIVRIIVGNALPSISTMSAPHIAVYSLVPRYYLALVIATVVVTSVYILNNSKPGLAMAAIRQDEDTAEAAGVDALKYKLIALGLSSFFAGLCGGIFAFFHVSYYPAHPFSVHWTFDALFIAYIGGIGTVTGPIVGTLFYIGLREILPFVLPQNIHTIVFGVLFIFVILLLPRGLVDLPQRWPGIINFFKGVVSGRRTEGF
jgi:branched-chain amino acid transport system permease protein